MAIMSARNTVMQREVARCSIISAKTHCGVTLTVSGYTRMHDGLRRLRAIAREYAMSVDRSTLTRREHT